jgi:hypothetical protein
MRMFMTGLIDYAGLFPPASLPMQQAVDQFAKHRHLNHAFALARFIVPLSRLEEWSEAAAKHLQSGAVPRGQAAPEPWRLSVLLDAKLEEGLARIEQFNDSHGVGQAHKHMHTAVIDTLEIKVNTPDIIDVAVESLPEDLFPFFEVPADGDFRSFATALAGTGFGAKLRTGGVVPELIPSVERVADFLITFNQAEVPIKCTAGLHHPLRGSYCLTYAPDSASATMHGFVNVFAAAAFIRALDVDRATAIKILSETDRSAFGFHGSSLSWRNLQLTTQQLEEVREDFAICFGSCSFSEPVEELHAMGLISQPALV